MPSSGPASPSCTSGFLSRGFSWGSPPRTPSREDNRGCAFSPQKDPLPPGLHISILPDHLLLACFSHLNWETRFSTIPRVCRAWTALAASPTPDLWHSVTVDFTAHIWLRAARLEAWLRRRAPAVSCLTLANSDTSAAPWSGGWGPSARMHSTLHDFYPHTGEGLTRLLGPLATLRELHISRCDDLLQRCALRGALASLPRLQRLEVVTSSAASWEGVDWGALRALRVLYLRCGLPEPSSAFGSETGGGGAAWAPAFPLPLDQLTGLTSLTLSCQDINSVPEEIAGIKGLRHLSLSSRNLRELPAAIGGLTALTSLSLSGCGLGYGVNPVGRGLARHTESHGLWSLPPELAACPLTRLDLVGSALGALPIAIGSLTRLEELNLGCNHITWLPENLQGLSRLRSLSLFSNNLQDIPQGLACLSGLEELFLDANPRLQFGKGASLLSQLPRLRCLSVMQDGCRSDMTFDFWSESSICFLHHLDLELKKRHNGRGYVRLH